MKSTEREFWESRYRARKTPWDFGGIPQALHDWLKRVPQAGRVLIPGCGSGYEVEAFHHHGWDVVAIDYSPVAIERSRLALGQLAEKIILADFFSHDFGETKFDVIYERTFLCSLPQEVWPNYVRRVRELLVAGGVLVGFFLYGQEEEPPPYPLTEKDANLLFSESFQLVTTESVADSLPLFAGRERWQVWQKRLEVVSKR